MLILAIRKSTGLKLLSQNKHTQKQDVLQEDPMLMRHSEQVSRTLLRATSIHLSLLQSDKVYFKSLYSLTQLSFI